MKRKILIFLTCLIPVTFLACGEKKETKESSMNKPNTESSSSIEDVTKKVAKKERESREKFFREWFLPLLDYTQEDLEKILKEKNIKYEYNSNDKLFKIKEPDGLVEDTIIVFYEKSKDGKADAVSYTYIGLDEKRIGAITKTDIGKSFMIQRNNEEPINIDYFSQFGDFLFDGIISNKETAFFDRYFDYFPILDKDKIVASVDADGMQYEFSSEHNQMQVFDTNTKDIISIAFNEDRFSVKGVVYFKFISEGNYKEATCLNANNKLNFSINDGKIKIVNSKKDVRNFLFV